MQQATSSTARLAWGEAAGSATPAKSRRASSVVAAAALALWAATGSWTGGDQIDWRRIVALAMGTAGGESATRADRWTGSATVERQAWRAGGYLGVSHTYRSKVSISNPPGTELTVSGFDWIGRPFKSPIYYGLRVDRVPQGPGLGLLIDFTHAKAIADAQSTAELAGTRNSQPVSGKAKIGEVFRHLEFSHGHNMLVANGVYRMFSLGPGFRPYAGAGVGISLPHTEVGFLGDNARTYEYQFAGFAGQVLAGLEVPFGRASLFVEWKFTYAPYAVPLSHEPYGWLLVTDVWRQFTAWLRSEKPPGGHLRTVLATHHGIGGVMVRIGPATSPR